MNFFKLIFEDIIVKTNGKKTYTGLLVTIVGIALFWTPAAPVATEVVLTGLSLTTGGLIHKVIKKKKGE